MTKYKSRKCEVDGIVFDSKKEARRWQELCLLESVGDLHNLQRQVPFVIIPKKGKQRETKYFADFVYTQNGELVVEDAKGFATEVYKLKKKLMYTTHDIEIREV